MGTYVTATGFNKRTLQEIKASLEAKFRTALGTNINTAAPAVIGTIIGVMSKELGDGWDGLQEIYTSHDPAAAVGSSLDIVAALTNVDRIEAAACVADLVLYTDNPTALVTVPNGKQARRVRGGVLFSLRSPVTIATASCRDIYLELPGLVAGVQVTLFCSFGTFTATGTGTDPQFSVMEQIAAQINADTSWDGTATAYRPSAPPATAQFTARKCLRIMHPTINFSVTIATYWECPLVGSHGLGDCLTAGPETADTGEISEIATPVSGWTNVINLMPASPGRNDETDDELRIRRNAATSQGYATEEAIKQAILNNVEGVISCFVKSNRTLGVPYTVTEFDAHLLSMGLAIGTTVYAPAPDDEGRPGKSFEVVVQGGENQDIANTIWGTFAAGIETYGLISVSVVDSEGVSQIIKFSKPSNKYLWIRLEYVVYNEETFPDDGEVQIADSIIAWAPGEYSLGKDIIPERILTPVYTVPGIGKVIVKVAITNSPTDLPTYTTDTISVGARDVALADNSRISFVRTA